MVTAKVDRLQVDTAKCAGCLSCMLACSLVHEGEENLSLSRIQVLHNTFGNFPDEIQIAVCRQCLKPRCMAVCPTGAIYIAQEHGNVKVIDASRCNGCLKCLDACPYKPQPLIWDAARRIVLKCDLCWHAPFWHEKGKQACIEVCPVKAICLEAVQTSVSEDNTSPTLSGEV